MVKYYFNMDKSQIEQARKVIRNAEWNTAVDKFPILGFKEWAIDDL